MKIGYYLKKTTEKPLEAQQETSVNTQKLPPGIRILTNSDGSAVYQARINRQGISADRRFATLKDATKWKSGVDYQIEMGGDVSHLIRQKSKGLHANAKSGGALPNQTSTDLEAIKAVGDRTPLSQFNRDLKQINPVATVDEVVSDYVNAIELSGKPMKANQRSDYMRVAHDLQGLVVATMRHEEVLAYIGELRKSPRQRDDPRFKNLEGVKTKAKLPLTAKERANDKYKAKLRAEALKNKPKVPPPMAEATVRKIFYALKKSINWYEKHDGPVHRSLFSFEKGQVPGAWDGHRERRLKDGEEKKLTEAGVDRGGFTYSGDDWAAVIGFALETGMREQEIAKAEFAHQWQEGEKLVIPKENSKTRKERDALLSKRAREIIAQQLACSPKKNKRIFHQFPSAKAICDGFARLTKRAGIEDLHFHDLRHEATSRLCESGKLKQMEIMEMTGHDTMTTFRRYVKLIAHENKRRLD